MSVLCHPLLYSVQGKGKKNAQNEKRQVQLGTLMSWMEFGLPCDAGRVPTTTNPEDAMAACYRSHTTQRTGAAALASLCFGNSQLWSYQHLQTRQMAEPRAGSPLFCILSAQAHSPWRAWQGHSNHSTAFVLCAWRGAQLTADHTGHTETLRELLSRISALLPAECFLRVTRKYQSPLFLGMCSMESWRPGRIQPCRNISELSTEPPLPAALSGSDWHQSPRAHRPIFICVYHMFCAT